MNETTASRLKKALALRNIKQIELSELTGIGKSAISQYLAGRVSPKQDKIYRMAKALQVNEGWLMGYDVPIERQRTALSAEEEKEITKIMEDMNQRLSQQSLVFEGKPVAPEDVQVILAAIQVGMELAKRRMESK